MYNYQHGRRYRRHRLSTEQWVVEVFSPYTKRWRMLEGFEYFSRSVDMQDTRPRMGGWRSYRLDRNLPLQRHQMVPRSNLAEVMAVAKKLYDDSRDAWRVRVRNVDTKDIILPEIL